MLYNYMYLYIIVKSAYNIFVTDMRAEIEAMDIKRKTNLLNYKKKLPTYVIILYICNAAF